MKEASNPNRSATRRYAKASSFYQSAVKFQLRRKGTTLASSPKLPTNREYHKNYSRKARRSGR